MINHDELVNHINSCLERGMSTLETLEDAKELAAIEISEILRTYWILNNTKPYREQA